MNSQKFLQIVIACILISQFADKILLNRYWKNRINFSSYNANVSNWTTFKKPFINDEQSICQLLQSQRALKVSLWLTPSSWKLYHAILVYETIDFEGNTYFWSIEKNTRQFELQQSSKLGDVVNYLKYQKRKLTKYFWFKNHVVWEEELHNGTSAASHFHFWDKFLNKLVYEHTQLYSFLFYNCHHYVEDVFSLITCKTDFNFQLHKRSYGLFSYLLFAVEDMYWVLVSMGHFQTILGKIR